MASAPPNRKLKVLHVLRAPVGGLFRHVADLTREQAKRGHSVGLVADSTTGGARAEEALAKLAPMLELGVTRVRMNRNPGWSDVGALRHAIERIRSTSPHIVHGHGSKGGVYARIAATLARSGAARCYTPHGGSFNYRPGSSIHHVYMTVEGALRSVTDMYLFESAFIQSCFHRYVGAARHEERVVVNGISPCEFIPVSPKDGAADFLYVGELRSAKGIDVLLDALARVSGSGAAPRLVLVGSGPDETMLTARARELRIAGQVTFAGAMPARDAFALGRTLIIPSRAESLPYVALEAAGACVPMISTNVGGLPEIFGPYADRLIPPDSVEALAREMQRALRRDDDPKARAQALAGYVANVFTLEGMVEGVIAAYHDAIADRRRRANASDESRFVEAAPPRSSL